MLELFEDELLLAFPPNENPPPSIAADAIDEHRLLLLEDGHCLKDHALAACNRPQLRAEARMLGTSLHTLVQMVDNGLGLTLVPQMAVSAGILRGTGIVTRRLEAAITSRRIALAWRRGSPRAAEFTMLGNALREISAELGIERNPD
jgi:LysR family transcriptional regulator, hydrogen peroxide-inducible genes activator